MMIGSFSTHRRIWDKNGEGCFSKSTMELAPQFYTESLYYGVLGLSWACSKITSFQAHSPLKKGCLIVLSC